MDRVNNRGCCCSVAAVSRRGTVIRRRWGRSTSASSTDKADDAGEKSKRGAHFVLDISRKRV